MELIVLNSSSKGNGYILTNGEETLILECGVKANEMKKALGFDTGSIKGVLVTHQHGDHSKYMGEYLPYSKIYATQQTIDGTKAKCKHALTPMPVNEVFKIDNFTVAAFPVNHDVYTVGFMIHHDDCGKILFLTDTSFVNYEFRGLDHVIIEANYSQPIMLDRVNKGEMHCARYNRTIGTHLGIDECVRVIANQDISKIKNVVLIHLSAENSDNELFTEVIEGNFGIQTFIAKKGLKVNLKKEGF